MNKKDNHYKPSIYFIKNKINNKIYVGKASHPLKRKSQHFSQLKNNTHKNSYLQTSFDKYGIDSFTFEIIEEFENTDIIDERESYWIEYYDSMNPKKGYNLESGGRQLKRLSESTKKKMSINNPRVWKGKRHGDHNLSKKTYQYDLDGNFIKEWASITEARDLGGFTNLDGISYCCTGTNNKYKTCHKFRWFHEYKGEKIKAFVKSLPNNTRKVNMICPRTNIVVKNFISGTEAAKFLGLKSNKIAEVIRGKRALFGGYKWSYV